MEGEGQPGIFQFRVRTDEEFISAYFQTAAVDSSVESSYYVLQLTQF